MPVADASLAGLNHHLQSPPNNRDINIAHDKEFATANAIFDQMKNTPGKPRNFKDPRRRSGAPETPSSVGNATSENAALSTAGGSPAEDPVSDVTEINHKYQNLFNNNHIGLLSAEPPLQLPTQLPVPIPPPPRVPSVAAPPGTPDPDLDVPDLAKLVPSYAVEALYEAQKEASGGDAAALSHGPETPSVSAE